MYKRVQFSILIILLFSCNELPVDKNQSKISFKSFNLFYLNGTDTIKETAQKKHVEVQYNNRVPSLIKYHLIERTVTLLLEDSFKSTQSQTVYVYSTSNFHGGASGRHTVYSGYTEEYKDLIYVFNSDTIICKSYKVPSSPNYDYALYLYLLKNDSVIKYQSGRNSENDGGYTSKELFNLWKDSLYQGYLKYSHPHSVIKKIPE